MASKGREKKLKTLTKEAIKFIRGFRYPYRIRRSDLERVLGVDKGMASRVVSSLQKLDVLSRPIQPSPAVRQDPYSRATYYEVDMDKLKKS